jgi:MFS family permease
MREHAVLGFVLGSTFVINGAWYTAMFLGLPLAIDRLGITGPGGSGLSAYGLVISAYGCTNLLATLVVGNLALPVHPGRRVFSGSVTTGTGIALLGIAMAMPLPTEARLPCFMAAAGLAAIGGPMSDVTIATLRQLLLAMTDMAAAMRAYMVMTNAGALLGMLLAPALIRTIGPPAMVLLCGLAIALTGAIGLLRHRDVRLAVA